MKSNSTPADRSRQTSPPNSFIPKSIWALAFSAFAIVTFEFIVVGLLPLIARDLNVELSQAGWLLTAFALLVAISGPILTALTAHVNRRKLFLLLLVVFVGANLLCAIAPNFWVLLIARVLPAPALALFWSVVSVAAGQLVPEAQRGRASAIVFAGISMAAVLGVPLGTFVASVFDWRAAYFVVAALSLLAFLALWVALPEVPIVTQGNALAQIGTFKQPVLIVGLAVSGIAFTGMFTAYTYLAAFLEDVSGFSISFVSALLLLFGAMGLLGNFLGGEAVAKRPIWATSLTLLVLAIAMALMSLVGTIPGVTVAVLVVWGVAHSASFIVNQYRVIGLAPQAPELAAALNVSICNVGIGLGAVVGGQVLRLGGLTATGWVAGVIALLALGLLYFSAHLSRHSSNSESISI
ncbi:MFS transporter [Leptolyngbya sp. FACHB-261]|uniref:MFS transporter n=1 Tax=Leptolyngbya sp. FACHB-261 TaxID=2692806 RepID=UPI00168659F7|nr:MFS transporter [Leptolyngbya sp. FACHB-261]MBD2100989.1 MFS transporter [Leptolyngbya sp. FACHB-261]